MVELEVPVDEVDVDVEPVVEEPKSPPTLCSTTWKLSPRRTALRPPEVTGAGATPAAETEAADDDDISEPSDKDKASGISCGTRRGPKRFWQARKDAELTASADSVRAYLKQIGKVALLNAEEEVELASGIEAGPTPPRNSLSCSTRA